MTLPRAGVKAEIDLSQWSSAISEMIADAARVQDSLMGLTVSVEIDSDFGTVEDAISTIEASDPEITVGADVSEMTGDVETGISDIEASDPEVTVGGDPEPMVSTVDEAVLGFDDLDPEVSVAGDPEPMVSSVDEAVLGFDDLDPEIPVTSDDKDISADIAEIKESLNTVKKLAIVDFIFNIPANFNAFVDTITNLPGVGFLVEADEALSHIAARTHQVVPGLEDVFNALRVESSDVAAIESALTFLIQNGVTAGDELANISELGLDFVDVWGGDVVQTLATAQQLVKSGLVPSIEDAFDVMTEGMLSNANAQGDLLTFLEKGAANFVELGITGQEAVALASGAIDAGVPDLQRYGQVFLGLRKDLAAGGEETQAILSEIGVDPDNLGLEGYVKLIDYLNDIEDQAIQTQAITDTFGSRAQGLTAPQLFAMPDTDVLEQDIDGIAADTGDTFEANISDSLNKAVDSFQVELVQALDDALNISGFIDKVTGAAVTFSQSIKEGMTIGQALEVSLALPEGSFARFESSVGNFAIGVLNLIAGVQDITGGDSTSTRATIARMAETQLAFDLQLANPEDFANIVQTAIDRGVTTSHIQDIVETSVGEMVDAGNLEEAETLVSAIRTETEMLSDNAQALIDKYGSAEEAVKAFGQASYESYDSDILPSYEAQQEAIDELQGSLGALALDTAALQAPIDEQKRVIEDQAAILDEATTLFLDGMQTNVDTAASGIVAAGEDMITSAGAFGTAVKTSTDKSVASVTNLNDKGSEQVAAFTQVWLALSGAITDTVTNLAGPLSDFADQLGTFIDLGTTSVQIGGQIGAQGGVTPSGDTFGASGGNFGVGMHVFGEQGPELAFLNQDVSLLNNRTSEAFMAGAQMAGGGTTVNMTNIFNNASAAASIGGINMVNNSLRGYLK